MMRLVVFALLVSPAVAAYDSKCRLTGDDCEGIAAAQTPWVGADAAGIFRSAEPGSFFVEVESRELPSLRTGALVTVRADGEALGTWIGTSLEFDGQDDPPVGSPGTIQIRISENGDRLFFDHMAVGSSIVPFGNRYTVDVVGGVLTGDNGLTGGSRRTVDATINGDTLAGVITLSDGGSTGLNSTIEFTTTRQ